MVAAAGVSTDAVYLAALFVRPPVPGRCRAAAPAGRHLRSGRNRGRFTIVQSRPPVPLASPLINASSPGSQQRVAGPPGRQAERERSVRCRLLVVRRGLRGCARQPASQPDSPPPIHRALERASGTDQMTAAIECAQYASLGIRQPSAEPASQPGLIGAALADEPPGNSSGAGGSRAPQQPGAAQPLGGQLPHHRYG